jgi:hypothetical protein
VDATSAVASFQAPIVTEDTVYVFSLEASDGVNTVTDDDVQILVKDLVTTAAAGPDRWVLEESVVTLDGSASLTTTGTLTYLWTQTGGSEVGVTGSTDAVVNFMAPLLWAGTETLTFLLTVDDGELGVSTDEVVITVINPLATSLVNADPTAIIKPWDPANWWTQGSANFNTETGILEITPAINNQVGAAWLNKTIDSTSFQAKFRAYIGDGNGADGMVFGWVREPAMGDAGGGMGWYGAAGPIGYALVFDTYPQPGTNRVSFEYSEVHAGGDTGGYASYEPPIDMENSGWFDVELKMDNGHLQVWMANEGAGMPRTLAIDYTLAGYQGFPAHFGFAGATGGLNNNHWFDHLPLAVADAYAARDLPSASYQAGVPVDVALSVRVNPAASLANVDVVEQIPPGLSESDVNAPGATVSGGQILWTLTGANIATQTLTYSVTPVAGMTDALVFSGTVSFPGESSDILGANALYPQPAAPRSLSVEMLQAAHLSWSDSLTVGTVRYNVYRSVNGGDYELIATTTATSYTDKWVSAGAIMLTRCLP